MIPKSINREIILKAIQEIDSKGIPLNRKSKKFVLCMENKFYPPKYVISLAYKYVEGIELDSNTFGGGLESNNFLKKLGFEIIKKQGSSDKTESKKITSTKVKLKTPKKGKSYRINEKLANFTIEINHLEPDPYFARITIGNKWGGNPEEVKKLLEKVYKLWPKDKKTKFLVTCGGFIHFNWPESLTHYNIQELKKNKSETLKILVEEAKKCIDKVINDDLKAKFKELTDYITLGIDSYKSKTNNILREPHVELVFLIDLKNNIDYWTGKSYPNTNQEKNLIDIEDLNSHFFDLNDVGNLMILGCHDITLFNNRVWNNTGEVKKQKKTRFRKLTEHKKPCCIIHHPHYTVKKRTWANPWNFLKKKCPFLKKMISTAIYHSNDDCSEWTDINDLLNYYKQGNCLDFICYHSN